MFAVAVAVTAACGPEPPIWPARFAITQRKIPDDMSGNATTVTWYDSVRGANLITITPDANKSDVLWDLELNTKHSYYFTPARRTCTEINFPVGILARDWLRNATFLGVKPCPFAAGKQCAAWTKAKFIDYYVDATTCEVWAWYFWGMAATFVTVHYDLNASAPAGYFEPPAYCTSAPPPPPSTAHGRLDEPVGARQHHVEQTGDLEREENTRREEA